MVYFNWSPFRRPGILLLVSIDATKIIFFPAQYSARWVPGRNCRMCSSPGINDMPRYRPWFGGWRRSRKCCLIHSNSHFLRLSLQRPNRERYHGCDCWSKNFSDISYALLTPLDWPKFIDDRNLITFPITLSYIFKYILHFMQLKLKIALNSRSL